MRSRRSLSWLCTCRGQCHPVPDLQFISVMKSYQNRIIVVHFKLTVNHKCPRLLDVHPAGQSVLDGAAILKPPDGRSGPARGLAGQDGYGVDREGLIGRPYGDYGRGLVQNGCHVQVGLGHSGAHDTQGGTNVETLVLFSYSLENNRVTFTESKIGMDLNAYIDCQGAFRRDQHLTMGGAGKHQVLGALLGPKHRRRGIATCHTLEFGDPIHTHSLVLGFHGK